MGTGSSKPFTQEQYNQVRFSRKEQKLKNTIFKTATFNTMNIKNGDFDVDFDSYMNRVFRDAENGKMLDRRKFTNALNIYNQLTGRVLSVGINPLDIIFYSKLRGGKQVIKFQPVTVMDSTKFVGLKWNLTKIVNYCMSKGQNNSTRQKLFYMQMVRKFSWTDMGHQNVIIVDTIREPYMVYILDPHGVSVDFNNESKKVNNYTEFEGRFESYVNFLKIQGKTYFHSDGYIADKIPCKQSMFIQIRHGENFCVSFATFEVYMISRYNADELPYLLYRNKNNKRNIDPNSFLMRYENMTDGQQRYVFGRFMEKLFRSIAGILTRAYPDPKQWDKLYKFINNVNDRTRFISAFTANKSLLNNENYNRKLETMSSLSEKNHINKMMHKHLALSRNHNNYTNIKSKALYNWKNSDPMFKGARLKGFGNNNNKGGAVNNKIRSVNKGNATTNKGTTGNNNKNRNGNKGIAGNNNKNRNGNKNTITNNGEIMVKNKTRITN